MVPYRRILRIPWREHVKNEIVLSKMKSKRTLGIKKRQMQFLEHVMRKDGSEKLTLSGHMKSEGDRRIRV